MVNQNLTVVVPSFNSAQFLPSCLTSLLQQSCPPAEIIVVDDCSTDNTDAILRQYPVKSLRLPRRMGAAYARVQGAKAAQGVNLAFLDADCIAGPDWLQELTLALTADVAGVGGGYRFDENTHLGATYIARLARDWFGRKQPEGKALLIGGNSAFRKEAFLGRPFFEELTYRHHYASGDDTLLCLEMLEQYKLNYLPHAHVTHLPYGLKGFFRRQVRWAKSRTMLFFKRSKRQKISLASGQMLPVLLQIVASGLVALSGGLLLFSYPAHVWLSAILLSTFLFLVFHQQPLCVMADRKRISLLWLPASLFLWLRGLCFLLGIVTAFLSLLKDFANDFLDKLLFGFSFILPHRLFKIYIFVTNRCNRRCEYCFFSNSLSSQDKPDSLSCDDFKTMSDNLPTIPYLTLTGGEPFLRKDLDQIALAFYKRNRVRYLVLPTNGTLPQATEETIERLLIDAPNLNLTVQVSLNGLEQYFLFGADCPGATTFMDTWHRLGRLQKRFKRLRRHLSLVITRDNCSVLKQLAVKIPSILRPEHFFITPERTGPNEVSLPHISIQEYIETLEKQKGYKHSGLFDRVFRIVYEMVRREFIKVYRLKKMPSPCLAGKKFIAIDPEGRVQVCELINDHIGSILDNKWADIKKGADYQNVINQIKHQDCVCTWGCAIVSNTIHRPSFGLFTDLFKIWK